MTLARELCPKIHKKDATSWIKHQGHILRGMQNHAHKSNNRLSTMKMKITHQKREEGRQKGPWSCMSSASHHQPKTVQPWPSMTWAKQPFTWLRHYNRTSHYQELNAILNASSRFGLQNRRHGNEHSSLPYKPALASNSSRNLLGSGQLGGHPTRPRSE